MEISDDLLASTLAPLLGFDLAPLLSTSRTAVASYAPHAKGRAQGALGSGAGGPLPAAEISDVATFVERMRTLIDIEREAEAAQTKEMVDAVSLQFAQVSEKQA